MHIDFSKIKFNKEKVAFCRFKKFSKKFLITNDIGKYFFLQPILFKKFLEGNLDSKTKIYRELEEKGFIKNKASTENLTNRYQEKNDFLFQGPSLHIIVATLRCNQKCIYCQTSSQPIDEKKYDMTIAIAKKTVNVIFSSPSPVINIEFQGGEPLINWKIVKFIVEYAKRKNENAKKELSMSLVSNFSLMTEEKYNFLIKNNVALCTSLDGPEKIHNKNRPYPENNSYQETIKWIKKIKAQEKKDSNLPRLKALSTISRYSLEHPKEIINEYLKWKFKEIHLRPLSYLGLSNEAKEEIGYSSEEFLKFWKKALDYIIKINLKGKLFQERSSKIMLQKILTDKDPGFLDLRSPCGAGIGQLLYNYDGKVYTCDEGRMVGDDTFVIGNIKKDGYKKIISHPRVRTLCMASLLEDLPCDNCVYKPYCGVCPVQNYASHKNIFPQLTNSEWCKFHKGALDYLFEKLENKAIERIFKKWI